MSLPAYCYGGPLVCTFDMPVTCLAAPTQGRTVILVHNGNRQCVWEAGRWCDQYDVECTEPGKECIGKTAPLAMRESSLNGLFGCVVAPELYIQPVLTGCCSSIDRHHQPRVSVCWEATAIERTTEAMRYVRPLVAHLPVPDIAWIIAGEYASGLVDCTDAAAVYTGQLKKAKELTIETAKSVICCESLLARMHRHASQLELRREALGLHQHSSTSVDAVVVSPPHPVIAGSGGDVPVYKFIDVQDLDHRELGLLPALPDAKERSHVTYEFPDEPVEDVDQDGLERSPSPPSVTYYAYTAPPSSPVSYRQLELDAQDDAFMRVYNEKGGLGERQQKRAEEYARFIAEMNAMTVPVLEPAPAPVPLARPKRSVRICDHVTTVPTVSRYRARCERQFTQLPAAVDDY